MRLACVIIPFLRLEADDMAALSAALISILLSMYRTQFCVG